MAGRTVKCVKLQRDLPGLEEPPWPGDLGKRIYENVSAEAWKLWEERMKMILNEYRLMPWQKEAQKLVAEQMEDFFFGEGSALPPEYVHPQAKQYNTSGLRSGRVPARTRPPGLRYRRPSGPTGSSVAMSNLK